MDKQNWEDNEFQKKVRITEEDLRWLKKEKGNKTIARKLQEIINFYKNHERLQKRRSN